MRNSPFPNRSTKHCNQGGALVQKANNKGDKNNISWTAQFHICLQHTCESQNSKNKRNGNQKFNVTTLLADQRVGRESYLMVTRFSFQEGTLPSWVTQHSTALGTFLCRIHNNFVLVIHKCTYVCMYGCRFE